MQEYKFNIHMNNEAIEEYIIFLRKEFFSFIYYGSKNNSELHLGIPDGQFEFEYKSMKMLYERITFPTIVGLSSAATRHYQTVLTIFCDKDKYTAIAIFKEFVRDAKIYFCRNLDTEIKIYLYNNSNWLSVDNLKKINYDNIYVNHTIKNKLHTDIKKFYDSAEKYNKFHFPYKKTYLLEGSSGCGKTLLVHAIASKLGKTLSVIHFDKNITESTIITAVSNLETESIFLIKNIDKICESEININVLFDIFNKNATRYGLVIFMTMNDISKIDYDFKKNIDYFVSFGHSRKKQYKETYKKYFPEKINNFKLFYNRIKKNKNMSLFLFDKFLFENLECDDIVKKIDEFDKFIAFYKKNDKGMYS
jgi:hypothetical protein